MTHPLVIQLRLARVKFAEGLGDVTSADAERIIAPMNSISWMVGHMAVHELRVWCEIAQGRPIAPEVLVCEGGQPQVSPEFSAMWSAWKQITTVADTYLDTLTQADMSRHLMWQDKPQRETIGTMLHRNIYHYFYHLGESQAVRQMLGHTDLLPFIGRIAPEYTYQAE